MQNNASAQDLSGKDRLAQNLRHFVNEADDLVKGALHTGEEQVDVVKAKLEQQLRHLRQQIDEIEDTMAHRARKAARATDEAVHAHPYTAMGVAGLIGAVICAIAMRR